MRNFHLAAYIMRGLPLSTLTAESQALPTFKNSELAKVERFLYNLHAFDAQSVFIWP